ncbi:MAG TPA: RICIN domain-containing protein [Mycobacteriales bacterium]|nr:RICIN domain-containing protein [Mycobacteriales bacterium]
MHPQHRGGGPAARVPARIWARVRLTGQRLLARWDRYDDELRYDPARRNRPVLIVIGAAAVVVLAAMVGLFVLASRSHPAPARAVVLTSPTPTPSPTPAPGTPPPTTPLASTASPTPTVPAGGTLRALHSGRCLTVRDDSREAGARLVQRGCDGAPAEGFHLVPVPAAVRTYELVNELTGRCVDVDSGSTADGAPVIQWDCTGHLNQQFTMRNVPGLAGSVQLVAMHSGKCLDVAGVSTANGAEIQQWACHPAETEATMRNQSWLLATGT